MPERRRLSVRGEQKRLGVHAILVDDHRKHIATHALQAFDVGEGGGRRHRIQEDVHAAHQIEVVVDLANGVGVWKTIEKPQRTEATSQRCPAW